MSDFLELLAADVADSSGASGMPGAPDSSDSAAPGITATNRAARTAKEIEKIVADFGGMCLTAKRPIGNSTAVVALIRPVGAATPEIICNTIAPSFAADRPIALGPQRTGADGAMRAIQATLYCLQAAPALAATVQPLPRPLRRGRP